MLQQFLSWYLQFLLMLVCSKLNPSYKNMKIRKLHFFNLLFSSSTLNVSAHGIYFDIINYFVELTFESMWGLIMYADGYATLLDFLIWCLYCILFVILKISEHQTRTFFNMELLNSAQLRMGLIACCKT